MAEIKILVVEDEWIIAEDICTKLQKAGYEVIGRAANSEEVMQTISKNIPDLILMDIALDGDEDGIEIAKKVKAIKDIPIVFLTNIYNTITIKRAQEVKPANYLLKPFNEHQLLLSIEYALYFVSEGIIPDPVSQEEPKVTPTQMLFDDHIYIRDRGGVFRKYHISQILFLEADRAYCHIHTSKGEYITQSSHMSRTFEKMNHSDLIQVSRSYVVNIRKIDAVKGNLLLVGNKEITVSDGYKESVFGKLRLLK